MSSPCGSVLALILCWSWHFIHKMMSSKDCKGCKNFCDCLSWRSHTSCTLCPLQWTRTLAHGARFCLTPSLGTSRPSDLWLTNLLSQDVIFSWIFLLWRCLCIFWIPLNFPQLQKPAAKSSTAELQNMWKSIFSSFLCPATQFLLMFPGSWMERDSGKSFAAYPFKDIHNSTDF